MLDTKMPRHISATEARQHLGALLDHVARTGAEYVIERAGKPAAAIIPIQVHYQHIVEPNAAFDRVEELRQCLTQSATVEEIEEAIADASESVRQPHK